MPPRLKRHLGGMHGGLCSAKHQVCVRVCAQLAAARREAEALEAARGALAREAEGLRADNRGLAGNAARLDSLSLEAEGLRRQVGVGSGLNPKTSKP